MAIANRTDIPGQHLAATCRVTDGRWEDLDLDTWTRPLSGVLVADVGAAPDVNNAVQAAAHLPKLPVGAVLTDDIGSPAPSAKERMP